MKRLSRTDGKLIFPYSVEIERPQRLPNDAMNLLRIEFS